MIESSVPRWMMVVFAVLVIGIGTALVIVSNQVGSTLAAIEANQGALEEAQGSLDDTQEQLGEVGSALGTVEGQIIRRFANYIQRLERKLRASGESVPQGGLAPLGGSAGGSSPGSNKGGQKDGGKGGTDNGTDAPPSGGEAPGGGGGGGGEEPGDPPPPPPGSVIEAVCERLPQVCEALPDERRTG